MKISFKENYKVDTYQYRITSLKIETVYIHYVTYLWMLQRAYARYDSDIQGKFPIDSTKLFCLLKNRRER